MSRLAISYSRVSSVEQVQRGAGLERQLERARAYCAKMGYVLEDKAIFQDKGVSAKSGANADIGELKKILDAIESKEIPKHSVLIIENLDRLTRDHILEANELFGRIIRAGIEIVTLHDEKSYTLEGIKRQPMDVMYAVISMLRASDENKRRIDIAVKNWAKSRRLAKETGIKDGHNIPKWLKPSKDKREWIRDENRVAVIERIFKDYLAGGSIAGIARILNNAGIKTNTGKAWMATTVKATLRNPAVIGEYHIGNRDPDGKKVKTGDIISDYYPRLISSEDFYRVQARLNLNPEKRSRPTRDETANLFHGIIRCGYCGGAMMLISGKVRKNFICMRSLNGGCVRLATSAVDIEQTVLLMSFQVTEAMSLAETDYAKVEQLDGEVAELEEKIRKLVELTAAAGNIEHAARLISDWKLQITQKKEEAAKERNIDAIRKEDAETTFDDVLNGVGDPEQRKKIMRQMRRYIELIEIFFAGDSLDEYRTLMASFEAKGLAGGEYQHELKAKFRPSGKWYARIHYRHPFRYEDKLMRAVEFGPYRMRMILATPIIKDGVTVESIPINSRMLSFNRQNGDATFAATTFSLPLDTGGGPAL